MFIKHWGAFPIRSMKRGLHAEGARSAPAGGAEQRLHPVICALWSRVSAVLLIFLSTVLNYYFIY